LSLVVVLVSVTVGGFWFGCRDERRRTRLLAEQKAAEWQIREIARIAMTRMLAEARERL